MFIKDLEPLFTPLERSLLTSLARYEFTDGVEVFGEIWAGRTESRELVNQPAYQSGLFTEESAALFVPLDHPLLTPAARSTLAGLTFGSAPVPGFWLQRASTDLRPNGNSTTSEMHLLRLVGGLQGEFEAAARVFNWDVSYNFGQSEIDIRSLEIDSERFLFALDAVADPLTGDAACRVKVDPASRPTDPATPSGTRHPSHVYDDCVPLDVFGAGRPGAAAVDYITADMLSKSSIEQRIFSANIATDMFELPAGDFGIAVGFEHRDESSDFRPDAFIQAGLGRSEAVNPVSGEYETNEIYAEVHAPLVSADMALPLLSSALFDVAWRSVDNSLAGRDDTWTIGARFAPVPDVEFRGNVTHSVRSAAIFEQFQPLVGSVTTVADPCDRNHVDEGTNPATRRANCISGGGHLPPIPDPDNFVSLAANFRVEGMVGGDPALQNEAADAWSAGVVLRPRFFDGLNIALDYVDIDIQDTIELAGTTFVMEACYDQAVFPNRFCDRFRREPDGQLPATDAFRVGFMNTGSKSFRGITAEILYSTELLAGQLGVNASIFHLLEDVTRIKDIVRDDTGEPGTPDWEGSVRIRYSRDRWAAMLQPRFIAGGSFENDHPPMNRDIMGEDDVWIVNGAFMYDINETVHLQLNVNNLFDTLPSPGAIASGNDDVYDNIGRYYRFGLRVQL